MCVGAVARVIRATATQQGIAGEGAVKRYKLLSSAEGAC